MRSVECVSELGFVETHGGHPTSMWSPNASGNYSLDNKIGRTHADQCVDLMRRQNNPALLGQVVRAMVDKGRFGGVEVGFMNRVADHAIRSIEPV